MNIGMTGSYQDNTKLQAIFENSSAMSVILDIPERFIKVCWEMLAKLNSTQNKIDVSSYSELARNVWQFYSEVRQLLSICLCLLYLVQDKGPG